MSHELRKKQKNKKIPVVKCENERVGNIPFLIVF